MALDSKQGIIVCPASTGIQTYTVGFEPKVVIFWCSKSTVQDSFNTHMRMGYGFASGPGTGTQFVVAGSGDDGQPSKNQSKPRFSNTSCVLSISDAATPITEFEANISEAFSTTGTGFKLNWTTVLSGAIIHYMALGGTDILNVKVASTTQITMGTTGNKTVTGVGFQPSYVQFLSDGKSASLPGTGGKGVSVGHAKTAVISFAISMLTKAQVGAAGKAATWLSNNGCIVHHKSNTTIESEANFVSMNPDGFTVNVITSKNDVAIAYLAIEGSANFRVHLASGLQKTSPGTVLHHGAGFKPSALMMFSSNSQFNNGVTNTQFTVGGSDGVNDSSQWAGNEDNPTGATHADSRPSNTKAIIHASPSSTPTLNAEASVQSFDDLGFTLNWTIADSVPRGFKYVQLGAVIPATITYFDPDAVGDSALWQIGAGSGAHYLQVDDGQASHDSDTTYLRKASGFGSQQRELYNFTNTINSGDTITEVKLIGTFRKTQGTPPTINFILKLNGTEVISSNKTTTLTYTDLSHIFPDKPGGTGWTPADLDNLQIGFYNTSAGGFNFGEELRCTRLYLQVSHIAGASIINLRISSDASVEQYNAPLWDANYNRRAEIRFGTNHDTLPIGYTADVQLFTGDETRVASNGVMNESIQHSGHHMIMDSLGNIYLTWLAKDSGVLNYHIYIAKRDGITGVWGSIVDVADAGTQSDTHFYPSILLDKNERIHIFYGAHESAGVGGRLDFIKSTNIRDETAWDVSTTPFTSTATYPRGVLSNNGDMYVFIRSDSTTSMGFHKSTDNGVTWQAYQKVVDYPTADIGTGSVYSGGVVYEKSIGRVHLTAQFWDSFGIQNLGRALAYIYSDDFTTWKDIDGNIIATTASDPLVYSDLINVSFPRLAIVFSGEGEVSPWNTHTIYHTNAQGLAIDDRGFPYVTYEDWQTPDGLQPNIRKPGGLWVASWNGSSWVKTNLRTVSQGQRTFHYREAGQIYTEESSVYIYCKAVPASGTIDYHAAEKFRYESFNRGVTWVGKYQTKNSSFGVGMISTMVNLPNGSDKHIVYARGTDVLHHTDNKYPYVQLDGDDVRVIRTSFNNGSYTHTELDRLPDRYQAEDTIISFNLDAEIPANQDYPHTYNRYWLYWAYPAASTPLSAVSTVFPFFDGAESYISNSDITGQGGWANGTAGEIKALSYHDLSVYINAHPNKIYSGSQSFWLNMPTTGDTSVDNLLSFTMDSHSIEAWLWSEASQPIVYIGLNDTISARHIQAGIGGNAAVGQYRKASVGDVWVISSETTAHNQYHHVKIKVSSSGVTILINGVSILTNDTWITEANKIIIGQFSGTVSP